MNKLAIYLSALGAAVVAQPAQAQLAAAQQAYMASSDVPEGVVYAGYCSENNGVITIKNAQVKSYFQSATYPLECRGGKQFSTITFTQAMLTDRIDEITFVRAANGQKGTMYISYKKREPAQPAFEICNGATIGGVCHPYGPIATSTSFAQGAPARQPANDPNHDAQCEAAMGNATAYASGMGSSASVSNGQYQKTNNGCRRLR